MTAARPARMAVGCGISLNTGASVHAFHFPDRAHARGSTKWEWVVGAIEGNQLDEVALITELQWHFHRRAFLKINNGWGLTTNATDLEPEIGLLVAF